MAGINVTGLFKVFNIFLARIYFNITGLKKEENEGE
jgi:hypothetical protein